MKPVYFLKEVYFALIANKVRSGLTVLGIVIGIASVISMIAIGQGSKDSIKSSIQSLGANLITVTPGKTKSFGFGVGGGRGTSTTLTSADAEAIKSNISNIKNMDTELSGRYQLIAKGTNTNTSVMGTTESYTSVRNLEVETGSFITDVDVTKMNKVVVIGPTVKEDLFGEDIDNSNVIGQKIRIKNYDFKIIGITKTKGSDGFNSQDNMVFIPITIAQSYLVGGKTKYVSTIAIQADDEKNMTKIQEDLTTLLLDRHKIEDSTLAD
ncbi:MAG: ABC transporter permease, partial [Patescibacteria group bacterium]